MKLVKKTAAVLASVAMLAGLTACGGGSKGKQTVQFMYGGSMELTSAYATMIKEYNATAGKKDNITVQGIPKSGSLDSVLPHQLPSASGPDVVAVSDEYFKKYTNYYEDLTGKFSDEVMNDLYANSTSRYHYNAETATSNADDPLYGVPVYNDTTVLYYNKTALAKNGVICISVDAEDLDAFNNDGAKDLNGKTKKDYKIDVTVPAKGFYRSESPYVPAEDETDGSSWSVPSDEVLIFNDRIPMNWDEVDDIAMISTKDKNEDSATQYGFYTEWWFNYGWSVGGDCLVDMTGKGAWTYALPSELPNYIVGEGKTYKGVYTGTEYKAGETLEPRDIVDAKAGDDISVETEDDTAFYYTVNGKEAKVRDFSKQIADGTLQQLPSTQTAFSRFCYLAGEGGINVCPYPSAFSGTSSVTYFTSGKLAMLVEKVSNISYIEKTLKDDWGVAPLPQYKTYTEPTNPDNDKVATQGKMAAHSLGYALIVSKKSESKDAAYKFIEWMITEGQKCLAENGHFSSRASDADLVVKNFKIGNGQAVVDALKASRAGDWWYMPDRTWIDTWATPLNNQVRYGKMTFEEFIYSYTEETNKQLAGYKK